MCKYRSWCLVLVSVGLPVQQNWLVPLGGYNNPLPFRASTYAPLTVHAELHTNPELCSGYNSSFEGLRGAFENLE